MSDAEPPLDPIQRDAQEQFTRQSHRYGRGHILEDVQDVRAAIEPLNLPPGVQALDVATGGGHTGLYLASLGHDVTLADLSQAMLDRASALAAERGLQVRTRRHPAETFPYPETSFDLVTCRVAPHHFSSPARFVGEVARVLRPGGHFVMIDGSVADDEPEVEEWLHVLEKLRDPSHHRLLTPRAAAQLCAASGLRVLRSELHPFKQPDLEWYFETAGTPPENRVKVRAMVADAPGRVRRLLRIAEEDGRIVWWWQRLTLVAQKAGGPAR